MSTPKRPPLAAAFAERAASVGTDVVASTRTEACALVARSLDRQGARRVALDADVLLTWPDLERCLRNAAFEVVVEADPGDLATTDAGVSCARFGIAETGSVGLAARAARDRLVSMLPSLHIVLLEESTLVPDLDAALGVVRTWAADEVRQPYVSLVTGASRTSDIERVLTIGVHGPRALQVILLSDG